MIKARQPANRAKGKLTPTEADEQNIVVQYLKAKKILFVAIPNGIFLPNVMPKGSKYHAMQARANMSAIAKIKKDGMKNGASDLLVYLPNVLLHLEMKVATGGVQSAEQRKFEEEVSKYPYAVYVLAKGHAEAIEAINRWAQK